MDEKKKSVPEETKDNVSKEEGVVEFDDIRNALDKLEAKKAAIEKELKEKEEKEKAEKKESETKMEDSEKTETEIKEEVSDKKETEIKTEASNKEETETKEEVSDKKETETKKEISEKKEEDSDKKKISSNKAVTQSKLLADAKAAQAEKAATKDVSTSSNTTEQKKKSKKGIGIFFGTLVALIAIVYIAGFVYFSNHFYPDVAINGTNVSNMNKETAKQVLDNFYSNYALSIETIDGEKVMISGSDIAMDIVLRDEFDKCFKEQKAAMWFVNMMNHHDYIIGADATWDSEALDGIYKKMSLLDEKNMTAPEDAYIGIIDGKLAIVKEVMGNTINVDNFKSTINDSLSGVIASVNLADAGCYKLPKVYDTDEALAKDYEAISEFAECVVTIQLDDLTLEPGMDLYNAVLEKSNDKYTVSKTKVQKYVKDLASQYDTMNKDRTFTSSFGNGKKVQVTGTAFGYEMDQEATANALYTALEAKKATTVEAIFKSKGYTLQGENDIGNTYIEVNLSEQKVVAYKDGKKIVEGDCVSGKEATGDGTCLGLYKIQDKLSPTVLRGQQKEVTKTVTKKKKGKKVKVKETKMEYEYESPVTFWLQFNGGYGLHDAAQWRSVYGGSIYYYSGSHGCVNLPYDVAEKIYQNFQIGDPVVVYFWDNENRK